MKLKALIIPTVISSFSLGLSAQTWTYSDCVDYAREHNISLQKSRLSQQTSEYNLQESEGLWQPTLDFSTSHSYTNSPWDNGNHNSYSGNYGLNAQWTLWNGGIRENTISRDRLLLERSRLTTGSMMRTLETDLLQVYINLLYTRAAVDICREAAELSGRQADRARQLMEGGRLSRVDYAQLNSQWEQDKYATVNAEATYNARCMELKQLLQLGLDSSVEVAPVEWNDSQVLAPLPSMDESYLMARNIDLQIEGLRVDSLTADYNLKIAKGARIPRIALSAGASTGTYAPGYAYINGLKRGLNEQIGISLSVPILDGKKNSSAISRAKIARDETGLNIADRENELQQTIEKWYTDTSSAQARYQAALSQLESAKLSDDLTTEKFTLGYVNPVELLTAHNALTEARHSILQAKCMAMLGQKMIEYYRTAKVEIN